MKLAHPVRSKSLELAIRRMRGCGELLDDEDDASRAAHLLHMIETLADEIKDEASSLANQAEKGYLS